MKNKYVGYCRAGFSPQKSGATCQLFFAEKRREALKGKPFQIKIAPIQKKKSFVSVLFL